MNDPRPSKSTIRQALLERRMQIPPDTRRSASDMACGLFFKHVTPPAGAVVAGYWPIRAELDDLPILRELARRHHPCVLPHVAGEGAPLLFRVWDETAPVITGKFGIVEPAAGEELLPDIILVPMAAFDTTGHRLGYGAGFYDRTLALLRRLKPVQAIGLAYEAQACERLPADDNDVRMDMIITERNIYK